MRPFAVCLLVCAVAALSGAAAVPKEKLEENELEENELEENELEENELEENELEENELDESGESDLVRRDSCPSDWTLINSRCFRYIPKLMSWARAQRNCESMGGNLASVQDIDQYHKIQGMIRKVTHEFNEAWIGGTDAPEENEWMWIDGKPFRYTDWCEGEPNNLRANQDCMTMNHKAEKCWDDQLCSNRRPSVCVK